MVDRPHQLDELVVDDADDLLAGIERAENFLAEGPFGDPLDEVVSDGEIDVGFEQGLAYLSHTVADVGLSDPAASAQLLERFAQTALNAFEHRPSPDVCRVIAG